MRGADQPVNWNEQRNRIIGLGNILRARVLPELKVQLQH